MSRRLTALGATCALLAIVIAVPLLAPLPPAPDVGRSGDVLLSGVSIIDVEHGRVLADRDLLVRDGVIAQIGEAGSINAGTATREVRGTGKFAIPGLWDMHTHSTQLAAQYQHPLYLANGVTGVREMWGCLSQPDSYIACHEDRQRWNRALQAGAAATPRFVAHASFQVNGGNEVPPGLPAFFSVGNARQAGQLVDHYAAQGVQFLKIYSELSAPRWRELAGEAQRRGLYLAGHRPLSVSLPELLQRGQRTVEHPRLFLFECYRKAQAFRALPNPLAAYTLDLQRDLVERHDAPGCARLMRDMAASDTAWVPTLQVLAMGARADDPALRHDARLKYIPWPIRVAMWGPDVERARRLAQTPGHADTQQRLYQLARDTVSRAHEAGVSLLLGTDAGDSYIFPGFAVHDELREMTAAGVPAAAALRMATLEPARFAGLSHRFGTISEGKAADILLLDENPLQRIGATRRPHAMLFNGQWFDRAALDTLLQFAEDRAGSWQLNLRLLVSALRSPIVRRQFAD